MWIGGFEWRMKGKLTFFVLNQMPSCSAFFPPLYVFFSLQPPNQYTNVRQMPCMRPIRQLETESKPDRNYIQTFSTGPRWDQSKYLRQIPKSHCNVYIFIVYRRLRTKSCVWTEVEFEEEKEGKTKVPGEEEERENHFVERVTEIERRHSLDK